MPVRGAVLTPRILFWRAAEAVLDVAHDAAERLVPRLNRAWYVAVNRRLAAEGRPHDEELRTP